MNLKRVLQSLSLGLFLIFLGNDAEAQAQLAAVNQDGLIQLGSNHPFVVDEYQIDVEAFNFANQNAAADFFAPYMSGFQFRFELGDDKVFMTVPRQMIADRDMPVEDMNKQLRAIHRINR